MWIFTLVSNTLILTMLWLLSEVAVTPAYNLAFEYAEAEMALPILTEWAFEIRPLIRLLPIVWAIITIVWGQRIYKKAKGERAECLAAHTSATICLGLVQLVFFATAGILPVLKFGAIIN